jgi:RNA polymerase sigma-70 factor (ECF subfamily)
MSAESTCWTQIRAAAAGDAGERDRFVRRYEPAVRAYLAARWRSAPGSPDLDDAVQDVFLACFRPDGVLERADADRPGGFRAFLYGVARTVARKAEERQARRKDRAPGDLDFDRVPADDESLAHVFDRAWAKALMREAAGLQAEHAAAAGEAAARRVELLRLRFHEGLPIRDIAERWGADPAKLHHEYARAREEFRSALREVVAFHQPGSPADIDRACAELLGLLG